MRTARSANVSWLMLGERPWRNRCVSIWSKLGMAAVGSRTGSRQAKWLRSRRHRHGGASGWRGFAWVGLRRLRTGPNFRRPDSQAASHQAQGDTESRFKAEGGRTLSSTSSSSWGCACAIAVGVQQNNEGCWGGCWASQLGSNLDRSMSSLPLRAGGVGKR